MNIEIYCKWATCVFISTVQQQLAALSKENLSGSGTVGDVTDDKVLLIYRGSRFSFDVFTELLKHNSQSTLKHEQETSCNPKHSAFALNQLYCLGVCSGAGVKQDKY